MVWYAHSGKEADAIEVFNTAGETLGCLCDGYNGIPLEQIAPHTKSWLHSSPATRPDFMQVIYLLCAFVFSSVKGG